MHYHQAGQAGKGVVNWQDSGKICLSTSLQTGKQNGGYIQCTSVKTLIFRLVMNFIRPKTHRSALWRCPILQ